MIDIKVNCGQHGFNPGNSVIIGSGILNALAIRESKDIDVVATEEKYEDLRNNNRFTRRISHGREILTDGLFEIGRTWTVVGKIWKFEDLLGRTLIIDDIRYIALDFLLEAKRDWIKNGEGRSKDIDDVKLMKEYLSALKN